LTYNINERKYNHLYSKNKSSIKNHITKTKLLPHFIKLTDYIKIEDAIEKEKLYLNFFKNKGYFILNKNKTGGVGGNNLKWNFENCKKEAFNYDNKKDFFIKSKSAYNSAFKKGWVDDICSHMIKK